MANQLFYTYTHPTSETPIVLAGKQYTGMNFVNGMPPNIILGTYYNSLVFDVKNRTIWHQGWPFGNACPGSSYGEVFNDFENNYVKGFYNHAEGSYTYIEEGTGNHIEGIGNSMTGSLTNASHVEGHLNELISCNYSHLEGASNNIKDSACLHVEGYNNTIEHSNHTHVEGITSIICSCNSHIEGQGHYVKNPSDNIGLSTIWSHTEGYSNSAYASLVHVEGSMNKVYGKHSHVEGYKNTVQGTYSHIGGLNNNIRNKTNVFVHGNNLEISNDNEVAFGTYNISRTGYVFSVGTGNNDLSRYNAFHILTDNNKNSVAYVLNKTDNRYHSLVDTYSSLDTTNTHIWKGTYNEFNAIENYPDDTLYFIEDDDTDVDHNFVTVEQYNELKDRVEKLEELLKRVIWKSNLDNNEVSYLWSGTHSNYNEITTKPNDTTFIIKKS